MKSKFTLEIPTHGVFLLASFKENGTLAKHYEEKENKRKTIFVVHENMRAV